MDSLKERDQNNFVNNERSNPSNHISYVEVATKEQNRVFDKDYAENIASTGRSLQGFNDRINS